MENSLGSFFCDGDGAGGLEGSSSAWAAAGSWELNPPFCADAYAALAAACERRLAAAEARGGALAYAVVVGATGPALGLASSGSRSATSNSSSSTTSSSSSLTNSSSSSGSSGPGADAAAALRKLAASRFLRLPPPGQPLASSASAAAASAAAAAATAAAGSVKSRLALWVPVAEHSYVSGQQHLHGAANNTFQACDTGVFFLQTTAAALQWPVDRSSVDALHRAFRESAHR